MRAEMLRGAGQFLRDNGVNPEKAVLWLELVLRLEEGQPLHDACQEMKKLHGFATLRVFYSTMKRPIAGILPEGMSAPRFAALAARGFQQEGS